MNNTTPATACAAALVSCCFHTGGWRFPRCFPASTWLISDGLHPRTLLVMACVADDTCQLTEEGKDREGESRVRGMRGGRKSGRENGRDYYTLRDSTTEQETTGYPTIEMDSDSSASHPRLLQHTVVHSRVGLSAMQPRHSHRHWRLMTWQPRACRVQGRGMA